MIHLGDCIEVMAQMAENSIDAIVTDPPYGLEFMGKDWDRLDLEMVGHSEGIVSRASGAKSRGIAGNFRRGELGQKMHEMQAWHEAWAREAFRVAKPGAYLLAFGGTRTVHRLASAIEDAGWEIRDELIWVYASGFPKSLDVSKALDKAAGAEREVVGRKTDPRYQYASDKGFDKYSEQSKGYDDGTTLGKWTEAGVMDTAPATDLAKQWEGWGTALKPAHEPIVMARKPLVGSVAANVTRYGTGALNIGATRIPGEPWATKKEEIRNPGVMVHDEARDADSRANIMFRHNPERSGDPSGRWPSNLLLSDAELFDVANPGVVGSGAVSNGSPAEWSRGDGKPTDLYEGGFKTPGEQFNGYGDSGGYSRFFIVPKSARADREPVLRGQLAERERVGESNWAGECNVCGSRMMLNGKTQCGHDDMRWVQGKARANSHPTVKPTDLMRHLVRLVTPPGGTVLDCFLGSGSTALACEMEGFQWIGIEKEAEYVAIAEARLNGVQRGLGLDVPAPTTPRKTIGGQAPASGPTLTGESTSNSRGKFNSVASTPFYGERKIAKVVEVVEPSAEIWPAPPIITEEP